MNFKYNIQIAGFKYDVTNFSDLMNEINQVSKNCTIQLLNADRIAMKTLLKTLELKYVCVHQPKDRYQKHWIF